MWIFVALVCGLCGPSYQVQDLSQSSSRNIDCEAVSSILTSGFVGVLSRLDALESQNRQAILHQAELLENTAVLMQQIADRIEQHSDVKGLTTEYKCGSSLEANRCGYSNEISTEGNHFSVLADSLSWPDDGFCTVLDPHRLPVSSYQLSADLYNVKADNMHHVGHLGIMYNARDAYNFDFVYIRPHFQDRCVQTGSVIDDELDWSLGVDTACPTHVESNTWFNLKVEVHADRQVASIFINGEQVPWEQKMGMPAIARGGVVVPVGYANRINFANITIEKL